jgi:hypothetical protein
VLDHALEGIDDAEIVVLWRTLHHIKATLELETDSSD